MGQPNKVAVLVDWLKKIHNDSNIDTRKFLSNYEFHTLYHSMSPKCEFTIKGFTTLLNRIDKDKIYINFKRRFTSQLPTDKRKYEYIILLDLETHLDVHGIRVGKKRKTIFKSDIPEQHSPPSKLQKIDQQQPVTPIPTTPVKRIDLIV